MHQPQTYVWEWNSRSEYWQIMASYLKGEQGHHMLEHAHIYYELVVNYSPIPIEHRVNGKVFQTTTPCILWRSPYVLHSVNTNHSYERFNLGFHPSVLPDLGGHAALGTLARCGAFTLPVDEAVLSELEPLLRRLHLVHENGLPKRVCHGLLNALLYEVSNLVPDSVMQQANVSYLQELMQYIVEHMHENLTTESLAERFYISRSKLVRDFSASMNRPLHKYITDIRVARAKVLLTQGISLDAIAAQCGFSQEPAFIYMFRRETGMTPGEWRKFLRDKSHT